VDHNPSVKEKRGIMLGATIEPIADTLAMPRWKVFAAVILTGIGLRRLSFSG
jgi:hypothetical protein